MTIEKTIEIIIAFFPNYFHILSSTLTKPRKLEKEVWSTFGYFTFKDQTITTSAINAGNKRIIRNISVNLIVFVAINIFLGSLFQSYLSNRPALENLPPLIFTKLFIWIIFSSIIFIPIKLIYKKTDYFQFLSLILIVISVGYLVSNLFALIIDPILPLGVYLFVALQVIFLWIYIPLSVLSIPSFARQFIPILLFIVYSTPYTFTYVWYSYFFYEHTNILAPRMDDDTPTPTSTLIYTDTPIPSETPMPTPTITETPTITPSPTITFTPTSTPTFIPCENRFDNRTYELPCEYSVQLGDSYNKLTNTFYNDLTYMSRLIEYNRKSDGTFVDLIYYDNENQKIRLFMFEKEQLNHSRYEMCSVDCSKSDFPCIYQMDRDEQYWQVSESCYGVDNYYVFIEQNNPYSDLEIVIPNLIVNGGFKINQKLEELQYYINLGDYSGAFDLHSISYKRNILKEPNGKQNIFINSFIGYYCVIPHAKEVTLLNQDYSYWEAEVDIYRCRENPSDIVSIPISESETITRNVCFVIENRRWVIDDWLYPDNHCP